MDVLMCAILLRISGSTGRIMQKFGVLLDPFTMHFTQARSGGHPQERKCNRASFLSTSRFCSLIAQKASYWCQPKSVTSDDLQKVNM